MNTSTSKWTILIASLACLVAVSIPRSTTAGAIYATWDGVVTTSFQEYVNNQLTGSGGGSYFGMMSLFYSSSTDIMTMFIGETYIVGALYPGSFGPTSGSGTVVGTIFPGGAYYFGYPYGEFSVSYPPLPPDGSIDTSGGSAFGYIYENTVNPLATGEVLTVSFQTIPEPSAIVLTASAILIVGIFAWVRRFGLLRGPRTA